MNATLHENDMIQPLEMNHGALSRRLAEHAERARLAYEGATAVMRPLDAQSIARMRATQEQHHAWCDVMHALESDATTPMRSAFLAAIGSISTCPGVAVDVLCAIEHELTTPAHAVRATWDGIDLGGPVEASFTVDAD